MSSAVRSLGIIMDGNGRWAAANGRQRTYGHLKGTRVAKKIITACQDRGIKYLTLYAFSTENWYRPNEEVSFLMKLLRKYLKREVANLIRKNIRLSFIGELERLPRELQLIMQEALENTSSCDGMNLIFAISYGSRGEITRAARRLAEKVLDGQLIPSEITEDIFSQHLETDRLPDPDLIIRTSGEFRLSNFLLWQSAYSELYFTNTLWPDFNEKDLDLALNNFSLRQRRFGGLKTKNEHISP